METVILFWYLSCTLGDCETAPFTLTREAAAIVACESGDGRSYGTYDARARSATSDGGLFQFNDKTYKGLTGNAHAEWDTVENQRTQFYRLWRDGKGWRHWTASQQCWSQWMDVVDDRAVWR